MCGPQPGENESLREGRGPGMPGPYRVAMKKGEDDLQSYLEQVFGKSDVTSVKMRAAVREWFDLYYGVPRAGEDTAPRVAALIVGKLCRTVFAEYETRLPPEAPDPLRRSLSALNAAAKTAMQYALVGGECLLKPVPRDGAFDFAAIRRDCYVPLARDAHGSLLAVGTMERHSVDGRQYALLERRTAGADGLTIETRLFELNGQTLGRCVPLATLPACAELVPQLVLPGVQGVGLAVLKTPLMNCVDGSTDAVSIYAPAAGLLHALARCEEQLNAEFANGASRVFASEDLLRPDAQGRRALQDDLFVGLPDDPANVGVTVYSPTLREGSYLARKQDLLRGCESLLGLRRGILSEVETPAEPRTATEIAATSVDYDLTIRDLQSAWTDTVQQAMALCSALRCTGWTVCRRPQPRLSTGATVFCMTVRVSGPSSVRWWTRGFCALSWRWRGILICRMRPRRSWQRSAAGLWAMQGGRNEPAVQCGGVRSPRPTMLQKVR